MANRSQRQPRAQRPDVPAVVTTTVEVGQTPGAPNTRQPPHPGQHRALVADSRKEYLAGHRSGSLWYLNLARSLEPFIDELEEHVGDDVYRKMLADPQVAGCVNIFKAKVLETGPTFSSAISDAEDPDHARADALCTWCTDIVSDLARSIDDVLWNMCDAFFLGNKVAELVYDYSDRYRDRGPKGASGQQLVLTDIKVKPRESVGFLVDAFMNILGILGHIPGNFYPIMPGMVYATIDHIPNLLPVDKFAILSFRPHDADPRGTSILLPAYNAYYIKQQLFKQYTQYLGQMVGGFLVGKPDPAATALHIQTDGGLPTGEVATPEEAMLQVLLKAQNGAALVVPPGAELEVHYPSGEGGAFLEGFRLLNTEIIKGILHVTLATNEGEHESRAASQTHLDVLSILVAQAKGSVERMIRSVLQRLVVNNYGEDALRLVPQVSLGDAEADDVPALMSSVAALMSAGYFSPDQMARLDELLRLPVRDADAVADAHAAPETPDGNGSAPRTAGGVGSPAGRRDGREQTHADPLHPEDTPIPASPGSYEPRPRRSA